MNKKATIIIFVLVTAAVVLAGGYFGWKYFQSADNETEKTSTLETPSKNTSGATDEKWQTYENSRYQFNIDYPADWKLGEEPTNNDGREFISPDEKITCRAFGFQNAMLNDDGNPQTLAEFIAWLIDYPEMEVELEQNTEMANQPAKELLYVASGETVRTVYILGSESGRGFNCNYDSSQTEAEFRENFTTMKESF